MRMRIGGFAGKIAGRLSLSIGRKMLLTAVVSLGAVSLLSLLHLQLGRTAAFPPGKAAPARRLPVTARLCPTP